MRHDLLHAIPSTIILDFILDLAKLNFYINTCRQIQTHESINHLRSGVADINEA